LLRLKQLTNELLVEKSDSDPTLKKVYDSYYRFLIDVRQYGRFTENADVNID
jgi:TRAP-type mannitol/chloroaromatic compound transport system substrate-binding protein